MKEPVDCLWKFYQYESIVDLEGLFIAPENWLDDKKELTLWLTGACYEVNVSKSCSILTDDPEAIKVVKMYKLDNIGWNLFKYIDENYTKCHVCKQYKDNDFIILDKVLYDHDLYICEDCDCLREDE